MRFLKHYGSQGSAATSVKYVMIVLYQILCRVQQWKDFENRLIFCEFIDMSKVSCFLTHSVVCSLSIQLPIPAKRTIIAVFANSEIKKCLRVSPGISVEQYGVYPTTLCLTLPPPHSR